LSFGSTNPVSVNSPGGGIATLTVTTTAPKSAALDLRRPVGNRWLIETGAWLALLGLFGIPARRRCWCALLGAFLFLVILESGLTGCGGGGTTKGGNPIPGTTVGTYTVKVTGTSSSITETGTVTLTVQ
jgi:hypothetical protein